MGYAYSVRTRGRYGVAGSRVLRAYALRECVLAFSRTGHNGDKPKRGGHIKDTTSTVALASLATAPAEHQASTGTGDP